MTDTTTSLEKPAIVHALDKMMANPWGRRVLALVGLVILPIQAIYRVFRPGPDTREILRTRVVLTAVNPDARGETHQIERKAEKLANARDWDEMHSIIALWDRSRAAESGGVRYVERASFQVLAPFTTAFEVDDCAPVPAGDIDYDWLEELEVTFAHRPNDHIMAGLLARAHQQAAWARRGGGWADDVTDVQWAAYGEHMERAQELLAPFDPVALDSPFLAQIAAEIQIGHSENANEVITSFERALTLDPQNWEICENFGFHLLPRWYGDYDVLELKARQHLSRTEAVSGAAAYAAYYLGALHRDPGAIAHVDADLFKAGAHDLITFQNGAQRRVNWFMNYAHSTFYPQVHDKLEGWEEVRDNRAALYPLVREIAERHLTCVMPEFWNNGAETARMALYLAFHREVDAGANIEVSETGIRIITAPEATPKP